MGKPKRVSVKDRDYRLKLKEDPVRYAAYLQKARARYHKRKEKKEIKLVADRTEREHRKKKQYWRATRRQYRQNKKQIDGFITPPMSPDSEPAQTAETERKRRGRKKVKRDRSAVYRRLERVETELQNKTRLLNMYKKRLERANKRTKEQAPDTPRTKTAKLLTGRSISRTRNKIKKQKRFLTDTLKDLHVKFLSEQPIAKLSYSLFCRLRPFWILSHDITQRETCICQIHDNLKLKARVLKSRNVLDTENVEDLISKICCSDKKECMYRTCPECKEKRLEFNVSEEESNILAKYQKWQQVSEEKSKRNPDGSTKTYTAKFTAKVEDEMRIRHLIEEFNDGLERICRHVFNIRHQYSQIRSLKQNLGADKALIHMDFSENYSCQYHQEVQSVHFGSSHNQATLHTVMLYTSAGSTPICTISDSMRKDPANWCHLNPILMFIKETFPEIKSLHFLSDGPSTQYKKNRTNVAMFSKKVYDMGFMEASWNFLETSHGKGAPDGIGAVIKRTVDRLISEKTDIPNSRILFENLNTITSIKLFFINSDDIIDEPLYNNVVAVKGTLKIHQLITTKFDEILFRDVSFCQGAHCDCYRPSRIQILKSPDEIGEHAAETIDSPSKDNSNSDTL
ncbi:hypothetical protein SNE40_010116 [Patella caerulea]|uniref:Uncharacterized protein n=1 Tax=Patella caerulea TaxID=87958 RepID=A0AAN8JPV8_PATCE